MFGRQKKGACQQYNYSTLWMKSKNYVIYMHRLELQIFRQGLHGVVHVAIFQNFTSSEIYYKYISMCVYKYNPRINGALFQYLVSAAFNGVLQEVH